MVELREMPALPVANFCSFAFTGHSKQERNQVTMRATQWSEAEQVQLFSEGSVLEMIKGMYLATGVAKRAHLVELHHRPGAGVSGLFEVINDPDGASNDGANTDTASQAIYLVGTTEKLSADLENVVRLTSEKGEVIFWEHPNDPGLPGLATASVPERVQTVWGSQGLLLDLQTVSYRPLRRAVLKAKFSETPEWVFLKVLRKDAQLLWHKHVLLHRAGVPVPEVIGEPVDEVVAFKTVQGLPMARAIMEAAEPPVSGGQIVSLLTTFPDELKNMEARPAWTDRLHWYAHAARTAIPGQTPRIDALKKRIDEVLSTAERGPLVANHGDFYEANVFVADGRICGLIDVDSAGPGYLIDDLACFIGHLAVLPTLDPRYAHVNGFVDYYLDEFAQYLKLQGITVNGLYARSASVVLTLIAGARDEEDPHWEDNAKARLRVAEELFARVS